MKKKTPKVVPLFKRIKTKSSNDVIKEIEQEIEKYKNRKKK